MDLVTTDPDNFDKIKVNDILISINKFIISHWNDRGNTNNYTSGIYGN